MKSIFKDLINASAIPIILSVLKKGDSYGYGIVQRVKELTNGGIAWRVESIYPLLKKLENGGMIKSYWKVQAGQRPRRYYTLLADGEKQLEQNIQEWELIQTAFAELLKPAT